MTGTKTPAPTSLALPLDPTSPAPPADSRRQARLDARIRCLEASIEDLKTGIGQFLDFFDEAKTAGTALHWARVTGDPIVTSRAEAMYEHLRDELRVRTRGIDGGIGQLTSLLLDLEKASKGELEAIPVASMRACFPEITRKYDQAQASLSLAALTIYPDQRDLLAGGERLMEEVHMALAILGYELRLAGS